MYRPRRNRAVNRGHQPQGLGQGHDDLLVVIEIVVGELATFAILEPFLADLIAADAETIKADPALRMREKELLKSNRLSQPVVDRINRVLRPEYFTNQVGVVILVPLPDDFFFFLWQNPSFRYADVRKIKTKDTFINNYDEIHFMLVEKRPYTTSFPAYWAWRRPYSSRFLAGNVILNVSNQVSAVVVVDKSR